MKLKLGFAAALLAVSSMASALEVGVNGSYEYGPTPERGGFGFTVGEKFGRAGITAGFDRYTRNINQNKYTLIASYDVVSLKSVQVAAKAGVGLLDNQAGVDNGYVGLVGVGVSVPLTKQLSATTDWRYQRGQDRVSQFNGNTLSAGLKYSF